MSETLLHRNYNGYFPCALSLAFCLLCSTTVAATMPVTQWQFSKEIGTKQQAEVKEWLSEVYLGLTRLLGATPAGYKVQIKYQASDRSPIPWARTVKGPSREVHFYIDPSRSWAQFRSDWTASHELTHMSFPYVGKDRWFAEGLASYLQYQVMFAADHIDWPAAASKIEERFRRVINSQVPDSWSVLQHNTRLNQHRDYPRLYWGGAAYFALVDRELWEGQKMRLTQVLREYIQCCFQTSRASAMDLLKQFDEISDSDVFLKTYRQEMLSNGTPDTETLGEWLHANPPELSR